MPLKRTAPAAFICPYFSRSKNIQHGSHPLVYPAPTGLRQYILLAYSYTMSLIRIAHTTMQEGDAMPVKTCVSGRVAVLFMFVILSVVMPFSAVEAADWSGWNLKQDIIVQERAGIDRINEPIDCEIQFFQPVRDGKRAAVEDNIRRELRIVRLNDNGAMTEIPSQAFHIQPSTPRREFDSSEKMDQNTVFIRMRVAFFLDIPAYETIRLCALLDNPKARKPKYKSVLNVDGSGVKYNIDNTGYSILTGEKSGQIVQIDYKFATKPSFSISWGDMHWNPDFIVVPDDFPTTGYRWWYAHHFEKPDTVIEDGPIFFSVRRKQLIPGQDTVYMDVYYRFYAGLPYFIMESYIEAKKTTKTFAIRNDEFTFKTEDFTHAGWRNRTPDLMEGHDGEMGGTPIFHDARLDHHALGSALPPNMSWVSFAHMENGYGFGSIRLDHKNVNALTGEPSPIYNSHTVISQHGGALYWFRSLVYSYRIINGVDTDTIKSRLITIPEGSSYYEKNAYVMYEFDMETKFDPMDNLWRKLRKPCEVIVPMTSVE